MARMKKATVKKAAPKKMVKKQASKEAPAPVPTKQNPQPPMGTPPMGANGPMMRKGGKIKKAANGATMTTTTDKTTKKPIYETSPYTKAKQDKQNKEDKYKNLGGEIGNSPFTKKELADKKRITGMKTGGKIKKAQGGTSFAKLAPPYDKATYADKIAGATKNKAKSGKTIKKAQGGALEPSAGRIQSTNQKIQSNVNKIAMKNTGNSRAGTAKNGKKVEKAQFGKLLGGVGKNLLGNVTNNLGGMLGGGIGKKLASFGSGAFSNSMKSGGSMKKKCKYGCK